MLQRAYSTLVLKAVDEDAREFTGIATTPTTDRMGDIVEPKGAQYELPIPLLLHHNNTQPIGHVIRAKVTEAGIEVVCKILKIDEPGTLKDRLDEAWQSVKHKLIRGLSIGFKPVEYSFIDDGYGMKFSLWQWLELSAVVIPANQDANIATIKSIDTLQRAATGTKRSVVRLKTAGVSADPIKPKPPEGTMKVQEQIDAFRKKREKTAADMDAIMTKAAGAGETLDAADSESYDTLTAELAEIDKHLSRLATLEKSQVASARTIDITTVVNQVQADQRGTRVEVLRAAPVLDKGIAMARVIRCIGLAAGNLMQAELIAAKQYPDDKRIGNIIKAAVDAASTTDASWAGALVGEESAVFADFVEFLRPLTIIGRFGTNGIPSLRRVPFRVALVGQTSGGSGYWVGEGQPKPLTAFDFVRTTLGPLKVANIAVVTMEVLRDSSPSAESIVRDALVAALRERLDIDFIDPAKTAVANVSPASILNGITGIASSGVDADAVRADLQALFGAFIAANNAPTSGVFLMPATTALALSLMQNPLGQAEFPGISMQGGNLFGLSVIVSEYVPADTSGAIVALVNAQDIYLADEGGFTVDMSREASLQMDDAPTNASVPATPTTLVSLWQTNSVGFRAERTINWARRRTSAVAYLTDVLWGS